MDSLPISVVNLICEFASQLDGTQWTLVFDEKTHSMKKVVNRYSPIHAFILNTILDKNRPRYIRMLLHHTLANTFHIIEGAKLLTIFTSEYVHYFIQYKEPRITPEDKDGDSTVSFKMATKTGPLLYGSVTLYNYAYIYVQSMFHIHHVTFDSESFDLIVEF